eukprot:1155453-Pelagomonas_calceolata.AAC.1
MVRSRTDTGEILLLWCVNTGEQSMVRSRTQVSFCHCGALTQVSKAWCVQGQTQVSNGAWQLSTGIHGAQRPSISEQSMLHDGQTQASNGQ